jgi:uncharacterized protein (TIGR02246 family)
VWLAGAALVPAGTVTVTKEETPMSKRVIWCTAIPVVAVGLVAVFTYTASPTAAQPPKNANPADETALMKNAEAFVAAFNKGDAKTLAAFWTPDGDFTDELGHKTVGREAIEKLFEGVFAEHKGMQLRIDITGLRFVTADVAIEDGTTALIHPDGLPPSRARYTNVHVRKDGKWSLESVRTATYTPPSNYEHLKGLDWLIGEWVDDVAKGEAARISFEWTDNQNFVISHFTTTIKGVAIGGGTVWIGWDPNAKSVRSWMFEANGGFGQGTWTKDGAKWTSKSTGTLQDGKKATSTNIVTRIDDDTLTWEVKERTLDDKPVPDIKPVKMKRVNEIAKNGK